MPAPHLTSWRKGPTLDALTSFIEASRDVARDQRVAVFDNDGTLWCEKPMYAQADFFIAQLHEMAAQRPALASRAEYAALLGGSGDAITKFGLPRLAIALTELFERMSPDEYARRARDFILTQKHHSGRTYAAMTYRPMLDLLDALRAAGFAVFIVSGGGVEFVRSVSMTLYGVAPEGVVGSAVTYEVATDEIGRPRLERTAELVGGANEGALKVSNIQGHLGRRPILAAGNSAGDSDMLNYALASGTPSLALLVHHDDADREYAYASEAGTFETSEVITDVAARSGWIVASMKDDWSTVFAS